MSQVFCPMPWITQSTRNNGDIRICCQANVGFDQGLARKERDITEAYSSITTTSYFNLDPGAYVEKVLKQHNRGWNTYFGELDTDLTSHTFDRHFGSLMNFCVKRIVLFRAVYVDEMQQVITFTLFRNKTDATKYIKESGIQKFLNDLESNGFDCTFLNNEMSNDDADGMVSLLRNLQKEKSKIVLRSDINYDYVDYWDLRNVAETYNAGTADLDEARNIPMLKDARIKMLNGEWPTVCKRCEDEEAAGLRSRMQYENERWTHQGVFDLKKAKQVTASDGSIDTSTLPVVYYDLRFGNLCNLKCRSCGPTDSSGWYEDRVKIHSPTYIDTVGVVKLVKNEKGKYEPENDIYGWYKSEKFWNQLEDKMSDIKHLYLVGGEPMMIDKHYEFLQKCIDAGKAEDIVLEYNTNITNIPERAWSIWKYFKEIQIGASVDGIGPVVEYMRNPAKWKILNRNIQRLDKAEGSFKLWFAPTISIFNGRHLPEMIIWVLEQQFSRFAVQTWKAPVTPHPLHHPKLYN